MLQNDSRTRLKTSLVVRAPARVLCVLASEWPGEGTGNAVCCTGLGNVTWKCLRLAVMEKGGGWLFREGSAPRAGPCKGPEAAETACS